MNTREASTVLAALRYWQEHTTMEDRRGDTVAADCGSPLDDPEIDALCETLWLSAENISSPLTKAAMKEILTTLRATHAVLKDRVSNARSLDQQSAAETVLLDWLNLHGEEMDELDVQLNG